jgi:beta-glucosidase-like glycosyl hydrolase
MSLLGLHWNFAPVADINSNPANPIINTRSFGETGDIVGFQAKSYAAGLASAGILATAKHFPGHGDTLQDSHRELPYLTQSLQVFESRELAPFVELIRSGIPSVMTAHLATPQLGSDLGAANEGDQRLPATLSRFVTTNLLRQRLGFDGVIVTDALEMKAITEHYGASQSAKLAFEAGADVILLPMSVESAIEGLSSANAERLRETGQRLLQLRERVRDAVMTTEQRLAQLREQQRLSREVSDRIATDAIEVRGVPRIDHEIDVVVLTDERPLAIMKAQRLAGSLSDSKFNSYVRTFTQSLDFAFDRPFVLVTFHRARGYIGGVDLAGNASVALKRLAAIASANLRGLVLVGSPYIEHLFPNAQFVVKTYSEASSSADAVVRLLLRQR